MDLGGVVALTLQIRGEQGGEFIGFRLTDDDASDGGVSLGNIFEHEPLGITPEWRSVVLPVSPALARELPRASFLALDLLHGTRAVVSVKEVALLPRLPGTEDWNALPISLEDYGLTRLDTPSLVVNQNPRSGTRVEMVPKATPADALPADFVPRSGAPPAARGYLLVSDFDTARPNRLGGYAGTFQRAPSNAQMSLTDAAARGRGGRSLEIIYDKAREGFCGVWVHLFDSSKPASERAYLDARSTPYLSFWVKGLHDGEDMEIHLADFRWQQRQDAVAVGTVRQVYAGSDNDWREIVIPLQAKRLTQLDLAHLASVSFSFRRPGTGTVYIDDIAFKTGPSVRSPQSVPPRARRQPLARATWLWDIKPYAAAAARKDLFRFLSGQGITIVFAQVGCRYVDVAGVETCELQHRPLLRQLIREASRRHIQVHALDGYSYHILPAWRERVYAWVRAILSYNTAVPRQERFAGIHQDNEPYLIPNFSGVVKEDLLAYFLDLTVGCRDLIRQSDARLAYGVDIPFWYDGVSLDWRGARKPMSAHVLDLVDNIAVMAYRTYADGGDGVVALARDEIDYADRLGKQVFVALETTTLADEKIYDFSRARPLRPGDAQADQAEAYLLVQQKGDTAVLYVKDAEAGNAGSAAPPSDAGDDGVYYTVRETKIPAQRLSFAGQPPAALEAVARQVSEAFAGDRGFAGLAIHDVEGYRRLLSPPLTSAKP